MKKIILIFFLVFGSVPLISFAQDQKLPILKAPDLKVSIPGMDKLGDITCTEGNTCNIPWLGQYIAGIQSYAIGVVGIIAVIVLMIGGIIWLTAAGNSSQITQAKKMIGGSFFGLLLVFGSYLILYMVNPNLTELKPIKISYIKNKALPFSLNQEEIESSRDAIHLPIATPLSIPPNSAINWNNSDINNFLSNLSFFNPYTYLKIKTAQAQISFNRPERIPLIQQTEPLYRDHDYSTEDGIPCKCGEETETTNSTCFIKKTKGIIKTEASTIWTSGCGIAALHMVMAAYEVIGESPQDLFNIAARMGDGNINKPKAWRECGGGTHWEGLAAYAQEKGMKAEYINATYAEFLVRQGYPIMLSVDSASGCTGGYHWIVVYWKEGKATYYVANPARRENENDYCQKTISSITKGVNRYLFIHP
jgi:hypothetical protein